MKKTTLRETVARVQSLIEGDKGSPLAGEAERRLREALAEAVGELEAPEDFQRREVTILLADLRGFTAVSELYSAEVVVQVLKRYFARMTEIIIGHQGRIDKFMGDSIMALFGAPEARSDDVVRAVACAADMQIAMDEFNGENTAAGMPELFMGVGINTGVVMAGMLGSPLYSEYAVIGDEVNLASRIEAISLRGQVLMGESTYRRCRGFVRAGEPIEVYVKGKTHPATMRELIAVPSLGKTVPRREMRRSPRAPVNIPFSYRLVDKKLVLPEERRGTILDLSYQGALAELVQQEAQHDEIKFDLALPMGRVAENLYAKIVKTRQEGDRCVASLEFTSVSPQDNIGIRRCVQLLMPEN